MNYFKNILEKFSKTKREKADLKRLESFIEHINNVLITSRQNGIVNAALVMSEKQMQDAENEIKEVKTKIRKRRFQAIFNLENNDSLVQSK